MTWLPLIAFLVVWIGGSYLYARLELGKVRKKPDLGPVGKRRYWWQDSLRNPSRHDPGGESF